MGKVFGTVMNNPLIDFCIRNKLIDDKQASHKKGSRTSDNAFIIKSLFEKYCGKTHNKLFIGFIDFKKAFDSIWHDALFVKLLRMNIGGNFYKTIKNMYKKTSSVVKIQNNLSPSFPICKGVRQGDILSPLLFNLFINDIVGEFEKPECDAPKINGKNIGCLLYADDLAIVSTTPLGLQSSLNNLHANCKKWKLEINIAKSKVMCMQKSNKPDESEFSINSTPIEKVQNYCYLGIDIASSGSFKQAEKSIANKASKALFKLKSLLYHVDIDIKIALKLFDQLIKPIALYSSEIWGPDVIKTCEDTFKFNDN